jgi:hypothetical protein
MQSLVRFIVILPGSLGPLALLAVFGSMWAYSVASGNDGPGLAVAATCCSLPPDPSRSGAPSADPYVVNFERGIGRVIVVPPWRSQLIQLIVEADGLEDTAYEAFIEREDGGGGVTLGPDNLQLAYGRKVGETMVAPARGRLLAWYICPERIVTGTRSRVVLRRVQQPGEVAAQSEPFEIRLPEPRREERP